jgi:hypothetical protein
MRNFLRLVLVAIAGFLLLTWWALESGGVAIVETRAADGSTRSTHVWFVEPGGELWIEAGTPKNGWYVDIQQERTLLFSAARRSGSYLAERVPGSDAHDRIRSLLRDKYGFRDWWIDLIFETSDSIAVRLVKHE